MLELVDEYFMCALSRMCGDAAIGRFPVVSASGEPLMPVNRSILKQPLPDSSMLRAPCAESVRVRGLACAMIMLKFIGDREDG